MNTGAAAAAAAIALFSVKPMMFMEGIISRPARPGFRFRMFEGGEGSAYIRAMMLATNKVAKFTARIAESERYGVVDWNELPMMMKDRIATP